VTGAGGFIGGHLVKHLVEEGNDVTGADVKARSDWEQRHVGALTFDHLDCANADQLAIVNSASGPFDEVYNLAADMGGIGFIESNKAACMLSVLITTQVLLAAVEHGWERVFYSSSACVYPAHLQRESNVAALREQDAYPADPEDGYGWEKLFGERMHRHFTEDNGLETRVARYHNVYGPHGTWRGGREKAPAALSRKVAEAVLSGESVIDVWGDGEQTRSFTHVDDAVVGTVKLMRSDVREPLNVGSDELVTINHVIDVIEAAADVKLERVYQLDAPKGVRGRNSDNTLVKRYLNWEPTITIAQGLPDTYRWVHDQVLAAGGWPTSEENDDE
jgi:nucleoside-diphosphate-sugar epimerase